MAQRLRSRFSLSSPGFDSWRSQNSSRFIRWHLESGSLNKSIEQSSIHLKRVLLVICATIWPSCRFQNCHLRLACGVFYAPNTISVQAVIISGGLWSTSKAKIRPNGFSWRREASMLGAQSHPAVILAFRVGRAVTNGRKTTSRVTLATSNCRHKERRTKIPPVGEWNKLNHLAVVSLE